ncbi:MAG: hypothetical protein ABJ242_08260 [Marinomonas sp.]
MTSIQSYADDPLWLPHQFNAGAREVTLVKLPRSRFAQAEFLANHKASAGDEARISLNDFTGAKVEAGPFHFIFHTAFCRSTLLVRALNIPGHSVGLSEPGVLANLAGQAAQSGKADGAMIAASTAWLGRLQSDSKAVFIKPTNHANALMPAMMQANPDARAVLMSNSLHDFLSAVNRRGLLGREWARKLYLEVGRYAPLDLGLDGAAQFALSDMQVAGIAWLLQRRWMLMVMEHVGQGRFVSLDSAVFNDNRAASLAAVTKACGVPLSVADAEKAASSNVFTAHAKLGGDFQTRESEQATRSTSAIWEEEAAQVAQWIGIIAGQAGIPETLPNAVI